MLRPLPARATENESRHCGSSKCNGWRFQNTWYGGKREGNRRRDSRLKLQRKWKQLLLPDMFNVTKIPRLRTAQQNSTRKHNTHTYKSSLVQIPEGPHSLLRILFTFSFQLSSSIRTWAGCSKSSHLIPLQLFIQMDQVSPQTECSTECTAQDCQGGTKRDAIEWTVFDGPDVWSWDRSDVSAGVDDADGGCALGSGTRDRVGNPSEHGESWCVASLKYTR